ncbi:MAG: exodeoxyribonuclease III [Treponema sp.]|jgi:exodeoxyribonuclease-3|nr:exodeoxyribonuclease III [Treponema sp.]
MRILSWNVNGIRAVEKRGFVQWVRDESPDILCIQETKARPEQLSPELMSPQDNTGAVYTSYWGSAKKAGYSGVAIYSKLPPLEVKPLGISEFDDEGRVLQADFKDFVLISAYFPNSQDGGARLDYKLAFCAAMRERGDTLVSQGRHLVICGDYNIAHTPIDLARPKDNEGNPGYLPEERAWMDTFTGAGYVDTFRHFHPNETGHYSWWSYRMHARERNVGWRIDYHCVDHAFMPQVQQAGIWVDVRGSDHCPVQLDLDLV